MRADLTLREWQRRQVRSLAWFQAEERRLQAQFEADIRQVREAQHEVLEQLGPIPDGLA